MTPKKDKKPKVLSQVTRLKDRAAQYMARGDWSRALRTLLIVEEHAPKDSYIARKIGEMCQRLGKVEKAVEAYKNAARLYAEDGFLYKAISVNKIILSLHPEDKEVQDALTALVSKQKGRRMFDPEHGDSIEPTASSKVVGVYLDRVSRETLLWIPLITELREDELSRVVDMMVRKKKRLHIMKRVDFEHDEKAWFAYTRDLSSGGAYLRSQYIVPEDTELELTFDLESDEEPLTVRGSVVRTYPRGEHKGFGVRFRQEGQEQALERISDKVLVTLEKQALEQLKKWPDDVDSLYDLAEVARERQDLVQTEKYLRRITAIVSPSVAHGYLAEVLLHRALEEDDESLIREAHDLFTTALKLDGDEALEGARTVLKERIDSYHSKRTEAKPEREDDEYGLDIDIYVDTDPDLVIPGEELESKQASIEKIERTLAARLAELEEREGKLRKLEEELEETRESLRNQQERQRKEESRLNVLKASIEKRRRELELWAQKLALRERILDTDLDS